MLRSEDKLSASITPRIDKACLNKYDFQKLIRPLSFFGPGPQEAR